MDKLFWNEAYEDDPKQTAVRDFFIAGEAANLPKGTALDMGCGTGDILLDLAAQGWSVTGVDFAEEAVRLARQAANDRGLAATFVVGDSTTWQAPRQFDLVFSTFAMPEGAGMPRVVAVMIAALKPGGTLLISEWDPRMSAIWDFDEDDLHAIEAYVAAMPGLEIEAAETRHVPDAFAGDEMRGGSGREAYVAFVCAKKPQPSPTALD